MALRSGEIIEIPSLVDVHVHLRDPGGEDQETMDSGTLAARYGGYQAVFDMPNNPNGFQTHSYRRLQEKIKIATEKAKVDIGFNVGVDLDNPNYEELMAMYNQAASLKIYAGKTTGNAKDYSLDQARGPIDAWNSMGVGRGYKKPIMLHGLGDVGAGIIDYALSINQPVHWCHVSTEQEAEASKNFSERHPRLFTAGVTPHHLTMTDVHADFNYGWNKARMVPPLGKEVDHDKLLDYFNKGYLHILETDHAPHTQKAKLKAEEENPKGSYEDGCTTCYGISGIEFVLPVMLALVQRGKITLDRLVDATYHQPVRMMGINPDKLGLKTLIEIGPRELTKDDQVSKSSNHPYVGWMGWGKVIGFQKDGKSIEVSDIDLSSPKILAGRR